jgi:hypothetical protein
MTYRWHKLDNGRSVYRNDRSERGPASELPSPMLISDQMADTWHPKDGKHYASKSEFRAVTRQGGSEEIGNDVTSDNRTSDPVTKSDVGEAIRKVREGYRPTVETDGKEGWS